MMLVLPATVSDDRGGFSCFSARKPTENHKNISFLIFFCQNICLYQIIYITLHRQNEITNRLKQQDYERNNDYRRNQQHCKQDV